MRIVITDVDYAPDDLYAQTPILGRILRSFPVAGGSDQHLAELDRPLKWKKDDAEVNVTHLVLGARWVGGVISANMRMTPVNICYVTDESILGDLSLDVKKCAFVAIGVANGGEAPTRRNQPRQAEVVHRNVDRVINHGSGFQPSCFGWRSIPGALPQAVMAARHWR